VSGRAAPRRAADHRGNVVCKRQGEWCGEIQGNEFKTDEFKEAGDVRAPAVRAAVVKTDRVLSPQLAARVRPQRQCTAFKHTR
jgi:hypothetical protein